MYAHTQTFLPRDHGRSIVQKSYLSEKYHLYIYYAHGIQSQTLAHMLDSLVRVSRRDDKKHFVSVDRILGRRCIPCRYTHLSPENNQAKLTHNINANEATLLPIGSFSAISGTL
jgi:tRNA isopentenyl-2-thiomethyl-A-37 hydroxylase MiaE